MSDERKDADGKPIRVGSVIAHLRDKDRGVVVQIGKVGDRPHDFLFSVGDLAIKITGCNGTTRCTNIYHDWRHIPRRDQTFMERWLAFDSTWDPEDHEHEDRSPEQIWMREAALALLPTDPRENDYTYPWPNHPEEAMYYLARWIDDQLEALRNPKR